MTDAKNDKPAEPTTQPSKKLDNENLNIL